MDKDTLNELFDGVAIMLGNDDFRKVLLTSQKQAILNALDAEVMIVDDVVVMTFLFVTLTIKKIAGEYHATFETDSNKLTEHLTRLNNEG